MVENDPSRPRYFDLKFRDCPHSLNIPIGHSGNCAVYCFVCQPEKREQPFPGKCFRCGQEDRKREQGYPTVRRDAISS